MDFCYKFIYKRNGGRSIEEDIGLDNLTNKAIFREAQTQSYCVVPVDDVWRLYNAIKPPKFIHEVIFGNNWQRLKFDIDILDEKSFPIDKFLDMVIRLVLINLNIEYFDVKQFTTEDISLFSSSGPVGEKYKYSFHIVVNTVALKNYKECNTFTRKVYEQIPEKFRNYLDTGVNKSIQNFRMVGSNKNNRMKRLDPRFAQVINLITVYAEDIIYINRAQVDPQPAAAAAVTVPTTDIIEQVLDNPVVKETIAAHTLYKVCGSLLIYKRVEPSFCKLCARQHDKDNTLMIIISETRVIEKCRHASSDNMRVLIEFERKTQKSWMKTLLENKSSNDYSSEFTNLPGSNIYADKVMHMLESDAPTLAVRAQMGAGKTKQLKEYIHNEIDNEQVRIVCLSFRQTFSSTLQNVFPTFDLYNTIRGNISLDVYPRLIIQVESLHRIILGDMPQILDVLVLDEVESILGQFSSTLHKNLSYSFAIFEWMLSTAKKVVCLDANLSDRTYNTLKDLRPQHAIKFHYNAYKFARNNNYFVTVNQSSWLANLLDLLKKNMRIVIPTNSLMEADNIYQMIINRFEHKKVLLYNSRSSPTVRAHFKNVDAHWGVDVLIYTPTVSSGISYEIEHFDVVCASFTNMSCDVETCRQMLFRVRSISTKEYYVLLRGGYNYLPTGREQIEKNLYKNREMLYNVPITINPVTGVIKPYKTNYLKLWIENIRISNLSRNNFSKRFLEQIIETGANVQYLEDVEDPENTLSLYSEAKNQISHEKCSAIGNAPELDYEEQINLRNRIIAGDVTITEADIYSLEKAKLRRSFDWFGKEMTSDFVQNYYPKSMRFMYNSLKKIMFSETIEDGLNMILSVERNLHEIKRSDRINKEIDDIGHFYQFHELYFGITLLSICGFNDVVDKHSIDVIELAALLRTNNEKIVSIMQRFSNSPQQFQISNKPVPYYDSDEKFVSVSLRRINKILKTLWGVEIVKRRDMYVLDRSSEGKKLPIVHEDSKQEFTIPVIYSPRI